MAWALVLFPATAVTAAAFATNCSLIVPSPVDSSPIRSPQAVHTALAQLFVGKSLIEIGTRNGDGMFCFAKVASSAVAIEYSKPYCDELERRAHGMFKVDCNDYQATTLDADYITWWQQAPLTNERALRRIQALQKEGTVRKSAQAVVLFDLAWHKDVASMHELLSYSSWQPKSHSTSAPCASRSRGRHRAAIRQRPATVRVALLSSRPCRLPSGWTQGRAGPRPSIGRTAQYMGRECRSCPSCLSCQRRPCPLAPSTYDGDLSAKPGTVGTWSIKHGLVFVGVALLIKPFSRAVYFISGSYSLEWRCS